MTEFLQIGILPVLVTLGAYQLGLLCQKKFKSALCNPILIAVILVIGFLSLTGMSNGEYQAQTAKYSWLMTPATICLAIPMYEQFQILRKNFKAILVGVAAGAMTCLAFVLVFALVAQFDRTLLVSMLPKSVTSAIGVPLAELAGGIPSVTTASIIFTGIFANITGTGLCRLFRLTEEIAMGVAFGTAGHVIATPRANEISPLTGATSSLSLVTAGLLTAAVFPLLVMWI